jgi:hypothetical protein
MNTSRVVRNMAALAFALLLLVPVPALALTFLGSWRYFTATNPANSSDVVGAFRTSSDNPNDYGLIIGMGMVSPPATITSFSVTATRDFQITDNSQLVKIAHTFGSLLENAGINVTISIQRYGVANDPFNFPPDSITAGNTPQNVGLDNFFSQRTLSMGLYRLSLTVTYNRTPPGKWNNSSPHTFTFQGL